jgi:hypothetical protein
VFENCCSVLLCCCFIWNRGVIRMKFLQNSTKYLCTVRKPYTLQQTCFFFLNIWPTHNLNWRTVCMCLLSWCSPGLTGTCWSLWDWCISKQTLAWSATCWRIWWRCVEEFSILCEACSCGTTCCSAHAMFCQMLPNQMMSQKARYNNIYNCNFSLIGVLLSAHNVRVVLEIL